jgi:hypothetical protein
VANEDDTIEIFCSVHVGAVSRWFVVFGAVIKERVRRKKRRHCRPGTPRVLWRHVKRAPVSRTVEWIRRQRRWRVSCKESEVLPGLDVSGVIQCVRERESRGRIISGHIWRTAGYGMGLGLITEIDVAPIHVHVVDALGGRRRRIGTVLYVTDDAGRGALATPPASAETRSAFATIHFGECCHHRRLVRGMGHYWRRYALPWDNDDFGMSPHLGREAWPHGAKAGVSPSPQKSQPRGNCSRHMIRHSNFWHTVSPCQADFCCVRVKLGVR